MNKNKYFYKKMVALNKARYYRRITLIKWFLLCGLLGYLIFHPFVMISAHLMHRSGPFSKTSLADTIAAEYAKAFSFQIMPWAFSYAIISGIAGSFYGRSRKVTAALRENERKFKELSITDDLTGLYNSRYFFNRLIAEIDRTNRYGHPLSLLILDLDNFKQYNDSYGHIAGDNILCGAGKILRKSLRKTDSAYRYGGEEFTIILPESLGEESVHYAERLRQSFESEAFSLEAKENLQVTVSIGVAQYIPGEEMSAFIRRTDKNMYVAKKREKIAFISLNRM